MYNIPIHYNNKCYIYLRKEKEKRKNLLFLYAFIFECMYKCRRASSQVNAFGKLLKDLFMYVCDN